MDGTLEGYVMSAKVLAFDASRRNPEGMSSIERKVRFGFDHPVADISLERWMFKSEIEGVFHFWSTCLEISARCVMMTLIR